MEREVRPISLRQLTFFGRTLTESRLISAANYVRTELPTRFVLNNISLFPRFIHDRVVFILFIFSFSTYNLIRLGYLIMNYP